MRRGEKPGQGKVYQVREYQPIIGRRPHSGVDPGTICQVEEDFFQELRNLYLEKAQEGEDGSAFLSLGKDCRLGGEVLKAKNYVGVLEGPSGSLLEILPKIYHAEESLEQTRKIFLKMLRYLGNYPGKSFRNARLETGETPLLEVFIRMYLDEVGALLKKGLKSAYRTLEGNLPYYKGKLQVAGQIRYNLVHKERFYVSYDEFLLDRPENRLVKATLEYLAPRSRDAGNIREIWQQLAHFDGVKASVHHEKEFARVTHDRSASHYETLLAWSRVFLGKKSFLSTPGVERASSILYPMEKVFEDYVGKNLRSLLWGTSWSAELQHKGPYLFDNYFQMKPDILLKEGGKPKVILDTKWKILTKEQRNYNISQQDMYQMYAYGKKFNVPEIVLLYPLARGFSNEMKISYDSGDGVRVRVFFVDLSRDIREVLVELLTMLEIQKGGS